MDLRPCPWRALTNTTRSSRGFTLMEVVVAVMLLASALVVILGLNYSSMDRTYRDRNQQQAMLLARSIMAAIENDPDLAMPGSETEVAYKLAHNFLNEGFECSGEDCSNIPPVWRRMMAELEVEKIEMPFARVGLAALTGPEPLKLKQVRLRLYWSDNPLDAVEVRYLLPDIAEEAME